MGEAGKIMLIAVDMIDQIDLGAPHLHGRLLDVMGPRDQKEVNGNLHLPELITEMYHSPHVLLLAKLPGKVRFGCIVDLFIIRLTYISPNTASQTNSKSDWDFP